MKTGDHRMDEGLRNWISVSLIEKAPEGFTGRVMNQVQSLGAVSPNPLYSWMKEYIYYFLAVVTTAILGLYFSGPYTWSPVLAGKDSWLSKLFHNLHFSFSDGLMHGSVSSQWITISAVVLLALVVFTLMDAMLRKTYKADFS